MEIKVSKYQNRVLVYGVEGGFPMFFDIDGRGKEIFPTGISSLFSMLLSLICICFFHVLHFLFPVFLVCGVPQLTS